MAERQGIERLNKLQRRWKTEGFVFCLLLGIAVSVLLTALCHALLGWPWWVGGLLLLACGSGALFFFPYWRIGLADIVRYLDRRLPELEESCGLLLRPEEELGALERLQVVRTENGLRRVGVGERGRSVLRPLRKKLWLAGGLFLLSILLSGGIVMGRKVQGKRAVMESASVEKTVLPGMREAKITITPPAYTGRTMRSQSDLSLQVEEGALLNWEVSTTVAVDTVSFLFNDTTSMLLQPVNAGRTIWRLSSRANLPGFYQVRIGAQLSTLYKLEIIKDEPPKITIHTPKSYTLLEYGESTHVPLQVKIQDDYGVSDAAIMATVSSGKGEAVKFKEQELRWGPMSGQASYDLSKTLDLSAMGLKPGDELYFYCRAKDSHGQEGRTDMYIITLADTAELMSLEGLAVPTDVKPEFFRSERQIIIETEQLLKEKDTLDVTAFKNKSNDLGIDQKLLRLRYGKFLGEEAEEGGDEAKRGDVGAASASAGDGKPGAFGDGAKILDAYTDKHDNAEDATFFEPGVKAQLKATLSEMWSAELRLRTYKPQEALPYAYKALRLLKDLQQQSRTFVAKTGVRTTPLNPAKRLTGELGGVQAPVQRAEKVAGLGEEEVLRIVLGVLAAGSRGAGDRVLLEQAERRLGAAATKRPGELLAGYQAMKRIMEAGEGKEDVLVAQQAIRKLLPVAQAEPVRSKTAVDAGLSQLYFRHINKP